MAAKLLSESKMRSGSDPSLVGCPTSKGGDEAKKPIMTLFNGMRSKSSHNKFKLRDSPDSSPKAGKWCNRAD